MKEDIYQFLQTIPAGKVISYKTLADHFGTSPRAIGKIMNSNRDPESFPCYKVVKSNGELGGFIGDAMKIHSRIFRNLGFSNVEYIPTILDA